MVTLEKLNIWDYEDFDVENEGEGEYLSFIYVDEEAFLDNVNVEKYIIAADLNSSLFLHEKVMSGKENLVASIQIPLLTNIKNSGDQTNATDRNILIYKCEEANSMYCLCKLPIPKQYVCNVVQQMCSFLKENCKVIVLSQYWSSSFKKTEMTEDIQFPTLRCLRVGSIKDCKIALLEQPNNMSGIASEVLMYCSKNNFNGVAYSVYAQPMYGLTNDRTVFEFFPSALQHHCVNVKHSLPDDGELQFQTDFLFS